MTGEGIREAARPAEEAVLSPKEVQLLAGEGRGLSDEQAPALTLHTLHGAGREEVGGRAAVRPESPKRAGGPLGHWPGHLGAARPGPHLLFPGWAGGGARDLIFATLLRPPAGAFSLSLEGTRQPLSTQMALCSPSIFLLQTVDLLRPLMRLQGGPYALQGQGVRQGRPQAREWWSTRLQSSCWTNSKPTGTRVHR